MQYVLLQKELDGIKKLKDLSKGLRYYLVLIEYCNIKNICGSR